VYSGASEYLNTLVIVYPDEGCGVVKPESILLFPIRVCSFTPAFFLIIVNNPLTASNLALKKLVPFFEM